MISISCKNSNKSVTFFRNGGHNDCIMAFANQDNEYWFTIGTYKSLKNAKRAAKKQLGDHGYTFDPIELENLNFAD